MRILHLISQTPDFTGSGKFIQQIITRAALRGHENFLVAGCQAGFSQDPGLVNRDHCRFVRFDGRDLPFPVAGMSDSMPYDSTVFSCMSKEDLGRYQKVFRSAVEAAVERFAPDLIHSHHLWILSALVREVIDQKAPGLPMVTTCHGTCLRQHLLCPHISRKVTPSLKGIDRVMALNPSQQEEIMARFGLGRDQVPVMAGGFDRDLFRPGIKPETGPVELVYAGKLSRAKGVPWLLKSLASVRDTDFRIHLAGGGAGDEKAACLELADALGEKAVVHGPLSHPDLAALLGQSHLFVLPSFFEGVPLVLMEALACGCRILTTELPGVREIFKVAGKAASFPGTIGSDLAGMIYFFPLPKLETIDAPFKADEPGLEADLSQMLARVTDRIRKNPLPDLDFAGRITGPFSWERVFERIEGVYKAVV